MIRITGGIRKGMALTAPQGTRTRPATGQVRQWIFDVLGPPTDDEVLDLFAGTGAVGIEALSRGAARALFVESWGGAVQALESNLERTGFVDASDIWRVDAGTAAARLKREGRRFALCFCDPPYDWKGLERFLEDSVLDLMAPGGTLVVEHRGAARLCPHGRSADREKTFGDTILSLWDQPLDDQEG